MKISLGLLVTALFWFSIVPVDAQTIYPIQRCRVYVDTSYTQIPGQCGTVRLFYYYPRKLFVRTLRQPLHYDDPHYY
jgi:hypothetical protein